MSIAVFWPKLPLHLHELREIDPILDFTETNMKKFVTAFALAIALPAAAYAQTAPAPAAKMDCCEKMKSAGKDMAGMDHSKMGHSMMGHGTQPAPQPQNPTHQH